MRMNKQIVISSILAGILLAGCGSEQTIKGDNEGNTSTTETTTVSDTESSGSTSGTSASDTANTTSSTTPQASVNVASENTEEESTSEIASSSIVSGSVVDGPIFGGKVKIFGLDDGLLAETVTDSAGGYSTTIDTLPKQYRVEVSGGRDIGADGVVNDNDSNLSFTMKAIVDNNSSDTQNIAHVTPATTLVADIVEDGVIPLDEAENIIKEGLGLDSENLPLCKLDPKKHDRANKAGNLIALLLKGIPHSNSKALFKVISKAFVSKKIKIKISNTMTSIETLDIAELAKSLALEDAESISLLDIEKLDKCKGNIADGIEGVINSMLPTDKMSTDAQYEVLSSMGAFTQLLAEINNTELENIQSENLLNMYKSLKEAMAIVLKDGGLDTSSHEQVELISELIKANGDQEVKTIKTQILAVSHSYKATIKLISSNKNILGNKKHLKRLLRKLYKHTNLADLSSLIETLKKNEVLEELSTQTIAIEEKLGTGEEKEDLRVALEQMVASQLSAKLERLAGSLLNVEMIKEELKKSLGNANVISSMRVKIKIKIKIKIKGKKQHLSHREKAELIASMQVLESINLSVSHKDFVSLNLASIEDFMEHLVEEIEKSLSTQSQEDYEEEIKALELSLANLSEAFDKVKYVERKKVVIKIIKKIKITNNGDYHKTIIKIKIKIKKEYREDIKNFLDIVKALEAIIESLVVPKVEEKRLIKLPQPTLQTLPTTPIMIAI